jgi:hypothetical protein
MPYGNASGTTVEEPETSLVLWTVLQFRSPQMSMCAVVIPAGSCQESDGFLELTFDPEMGEIGRGAGTTHCPFLATSGAVQVTSHFPEMHERAPSHVVPQHA